MTWSTTSIAGPVGRSPLLASSSSEAKGRVLKKKRRTSASSSWQWRRQERGEEGEMWTLAWPRVRPADARSHLWPLQRGKVAAARVLCPLRQVKGQPPERARHDKEVLGENRHGRGDGAVAGANGQLLARDARQALAVEEKGGGDALR